MTVYFPLITRLGTRRPAEAYPYKSGHDPTQRLDSCSHYHYRSEARFLCPLDWESSTTFQFNFVAHLHIASSAPHHSHQISPRSCRKSSTRPRACTLTICQWMHPTCCVCSLRKSQQTFAAGRSCWLMRGLETLHLMSRRSSEFLHAAGGLMNLLPFECRVFSRANRRHFSRQANGLHLRAMTKECSYWRWRRCRAMTFRLTPFRHQRWVEAAALCLNCC